MQQDTVRRVPGYDEQLLTVAGKGDCTVPGYPGVHADRRCRHKNNEQHLEKTDW